jgi:hypothetical protein
LPTGFTPYLQLIHGLMNCSGRTQYPGRFRFHGGASTGPITEAGRQRCAEAKTVHGRETRAIRTERSQASARLSVLEQVGFEIGLMTGSRTRGRKPSKMGEAYPEIQTALRLIRAGKASVL